MHRGCAAETADQTRKTVFPDHLPLTLPASDDVIAVRLEGTCVSPNDVPGYDKDQYMPAGMTYAYKDQDGNTYRMGHVLRY